MKRQMSLREKSEQSIFSMAEKNDESHGGFQGI